MNGAATFPGSQVIWAVLTATLLRFGWLLVRGPELTFPDEERFWCAALSWANGGQIGCGEKIAHDMPLTALLAGTVVQIAGPNLWATKLATASLSALTVIPCALIAWRITHERMAAVLAAYGFAVYPFSIYYSALLLSETLFLLCLTSVMVVVTALCAQPRSFDTPMQRMAWGVGLGVTCGLAHLTRPTLMYFLPVLLLWVPLAARRSWWIPVIAVICALAITLPWIVRNHDAFGHILPGTLGVGQVLLEGNTPLNSTGGVLAPNAGYLRDLPPGLNEFEQDDWKRKRALVHIREAPQQFLTLAWRKALRLWNIVPNAKQFRTPLYRWVSIVSFGPVVVLAALFPFLTPSSWRLWAPVLLLVGYVTAVHMVTIGSIRYRLPLEPTLLALAAGSASILALMYRKHRGLAADPNRPVGLVAGSPSRGMKPTGQPSEDTQPDGAAHKPPS